jgi:hypothetical protein
VFAGVGLQVHPQFSLNTAWSGVGVNVGPPLCRCPRCPSPSICSMATSATIRGRVPSQC